METSPQKIVNRNSSYKKLANNRKSTDSNEEKKGKPYRLTIQIDKIYLRPCPKSKKINQLNTNSGIIQKVAKERLQNLQCLVCKMKFTTTSAMYKHIKEHFMCDICNTEFSSQKSFKKHIKIHQSENSERPYKCHVCGMLFNTKEDIKNHSHLKLIKYNDVDDGRIQYCKTCDMTFTSETVFRKHLSSHVEKVTDIPVNDNKQNAVTTPVSAGLLRPILFSCRLCNHNFNNLADIDRHTKIHMDEMEPVD